MFSAYFGGSNILPVLAAGDDYAVMTQFSVDVEDDVGASPEAKISCPGEFEVKWRR